MEQKEATPPPVSSQTHIQLHCLPHSGISTSPTAGGSDSHVTIAIRSLFCSPRIGDVDADIMKQSLPGARISTQMQKKDIIPGAQLRVDAIMMGIGGVPHHSTPVRTVSSSGLKHVEEKRENHGHVHAPQITATHSCTWDRGNKIVLPVRYKDIQRDACIQLRLVTTRDRVLGEVLFPLWDEKGRLKTGLQRIKIDLKETRQNIVSDNEHPVMNDADEDEDEKWEASLILDKLHRIGKESSKDTGVSQNSIKMKTKAGEVERSRKQRNIFEKKSNDASIECVPWLDKLTKERCIGIIKEDFCGIQNGNDLDLLEKKNYVYLVVELPDCNIPIVYQEVLYTGGIHGASGSVTALDLSLYHHEQHLQRQKHQQKESNRGTYNMDGKILMPQPTNAQIQDNSNEMNYRLVQLLDMESVDDNPVEDKYRTLQHELIRGLVDPALKPDASERSRLNAIISGTSQHLTREEKDLLWRFRFSLVDNSQALTKFLLAVEWTVESEVVQAVELLEQWRKRSPINVSDALKLLGKNVAFQTGLVRAYAIDTLAAAPDAELELYLLQLVQALKYEHEHDGGSGRRKKEDKTSSLGDFLIERAAGNIELANYLYWYLKVNLADSTFGQRYRDVFLSMKEKLSKIQHKSQATDNRSMWGVLVAQDGFISTIMDCQRAAFHVKGKKDAKEKHLKDSLNSPSCKALKNGFGVPLPSAPRTWVDGVQAKTARMFKSAMYPALLEFDVANDADATYKVIVKTGDDLRQDQLVIMFIKLFDRILKRGALDLCLKPYPIMAMSQDTGLVEFVEGSMPISQILSNHNNSIMAFFRSVAPQEGAKYGIDPNVLQTYIRSCAGYCVITYLIGVGDRHL